MLAEAGRNPAMAAILQQHSGQLFSLLADYLRDGQRRGQIDRTLDADLAAAILVSVMDGFKTLAIRDPALDMAATVDLRKTLISRFLTPPLDSAPMKPAH
jgi:hypothetical protein